MKLIVLLCAILLLCGCTKQTEIEETKQVSSEITSALSSETKENEATEMITEPTESTKINDKDVPSILREALTEITSFSMQERIMELISAGFERECTQTMAADGSFHFTADSRQWNYNYDQDSTQQVEYYYQYEDGVMTCYYRIDGGQLMKNTLTKQMEAEIEASFQMIAGPDTLIPMYLENFQYAGIDEESGLFMFTFDLPISEIERASDKNADFLSIVISFSGVESTDEFSDLAVKCTLWVEPEDMRPVHLRQSYEELKPYILTNGTISGEYALEFEAIYLDYVLGYDVIEKIEIPAEFLAS